MSSIKDLISKATVANIVSAFVVIAGMCYAIYSGNKDLVVFLAGAGIGYLFKGVSR